MLVRISAKRVFQASARRFRVFVLVLPVGMLAACGGGGAGDPGADVSSTPTGGSPPSALIFSANPASIVSGGSPMLSWSADSATSCTASSSPAGLWSGIKSTSGSNVSTGALTITTTFTLSCTGNGGSMNKSVTVNVYTTLPPPPTGDALTMPSLNDEKAAYTNWGWTWTPAQESDKITEPLLNYSVNASGVDIHGDTEGDDLWTYLMMYRRTGNTVYLKRAEAWLKYFKQDYRANLNTDADGALDHMYGWGLVTWYEHTCALGSCDLEALTEAENLAVAMEKHWNAQDGYLSSKPVPGEYRVDYSLRRTARHLLLATRVAEVTKKQRWIDLRDYLIELWLQSPNWDASRGMYFAGDWQTDVEYGLGSGAYARGARAQSSFQIGILAEAFAHAYRTTGRVELRDRLIKMAYFVKDYGLDPFYQYSGSVFGVVDGKPWHNYSATCGTSCTVWYPVYTTSLVNTLMWGYKLTGDVSFQNRAKFFFERGTKGKYGSVTDRSPDETVDHFVDTIFNSGDGYYYLGYNKGELQYTYLVFGNGGLP